MGVATFSTSSLAGGTQSITAVYPGDANFITSTSTVVSQVVNQTTTTLVLDSTGAQSLTFTVTVTASPGLGTPTGTVTFYLSKRP